MDLGLKNKVALVTGGARGVGRGIVTALAEEGCNIISIDLNFDDEAINYSEELAQRTNVKVVRLLGDVTNYETCCNFFKEAGKYFEAVDIVVNCAGIGMRRDITEMSLSDWHLTQDVNINGPFYISREFVKICREEGRKGNIVNVLSKSAFTTNSKDTTAYVSAKAGLVGLTRGMANECFQYGVRINGVIPGYVENPKVYPEGDPITEKRKSILPLGRLAKPIEIGRVVAFLASECSIEMIGACVDVSGGTML